MEEEKIRVLLVEDDEDDFVIFRNLLSQIQGRSFDLDWTPSYEDALEKTLRKTYDVSFFDYRLGKATGLELLREVREQGSDAPIIILTGRGDYDVDVQAMREGAADYLEKGHLDAVLLERSIRYALEHTRILRKLRESKDQLRTLSARLLDTQENERKILAQELHDSIGANLTAIKYALEKKVSDMRSRSEAPKGISLEQIIEMVRGTIDEIQRISANLRPSILDDMGILKTINWTCRKFQELYSDIRLECRLKVEEHEVPQELKIVIYRIVQEALNNVSRHSGADLVSVSLERDDIGLELTIKDNGRGFSVRDLQSENRRRGLGVSGMKERAMLSEGVLNIESKAGEGTEIKAYWPQAFTVPELVSD